jgi:hypothetical protein
MNARTFGAGILVGAVLFTGLSIALAWTGPTVAPPNGNVPAPINTGTTNQVKDAGLSVDALAVFGNAILSGTSRYLNFGTVVGSTGYGFRDSAGVMQLKNSGGAWVNIPTSTDGAETDPQVGVLTNGRWCTSDGASVNCNSVAPVITEADPQVGTLTNGMWCTTNGTNINCTSAAPVGGISANTTASCSASTFTNCIATCPSGYYRTGCSGGHAVPSGSNGCTGASINAGTIHAYCAR